VARPEQLRAWIDATPDLLTTVRLDPHCVSVEYAAIPRRVRAKYGVLLIGRNLRYTRRQSSPLEFRSEG
jgi:hypothetical protein